MFNVCIYFYYLFIPCLKIRFHFILQSTEKNYYNIDIVIWHPWRHNLTWFFDKKDTKIRTKIKSIEQSAGDW